MGSRSIAFYDFQGLQWKYSNLHPYGEKRLNILLVVEGKNKHLNEAKMKLEFSSSQ
jgi:hypothetical protein